MPGKGGGKADGKGGGGTRGDGAFTGMGETRSAKAKWGVNVTEQFRIDTDKMLKALREDDVEEIAFPPDLSNDQRRFMHRHCEKLGLFSKSRGKGDKRYLTVTKEKKRGAPQPNQYVEPEPVPEFQLSPGGAAEAAIKKHLAAWPVTEDDLLYDATAQPAPKHSGRSKGGGGKGGGKGGNGATKLAARLAKATAAAAAAERHKAAPQSPFRQRQRERERLPAWEFGERIQALVRDHQVSIVSGETGCGKSTQVPQFILDDATPGMAPPTIVVTQPRRLAAQALAGRIAHERGQEAGAQVGYNIRLDSKSSAATMLTFMTTGVLLRRLASDPLLTDFTHIVMDEVHERDKYADFLMVLLKDVLPRRPDLRLVLMSATIQLTTFSRYFGGAPNITIGASVFPVGEYFLEDVLALTNFVQIGQSRGDSLLGGNKSMGMGGGGGGGSRGPGGGRGVDTTVDDAAYDYTCHMCGKRDFEDAGDFGLHVATCFGVEGGLAEGELVDASTFSLDSLGAGLAGGLDAGLGMQLGEADASKAGGDAGKVTKDAGGGEMSSTADRVGIGIAGVKMESTEADLAEAVARYGAGFDDDAAVDLDLVHALLEHIEQANYGDGAVLVFLPGWDDISRLKDALLFSHRFGNADKYTILPLHSGVAPKEQNLVFKRPKPGQRKIILSTNIAETSVTIDDVVYVIDSGKAKEKSFDPHLNLATLMTGWISAASARQRKGRAGRVQAGVCFHMYSSTRVKSLLPYQQPELLRTPLEELALQVKLLSSVPHQPKGYVAGFLARAPEPPHPKAVENGLALLMDIGALTRDEQMTELGNYLGQLPVDPRVGKMCLLAHLFGVTRLATTIAAGMGYRDPFVLPMNEQAKAKAKASKARFASGYPSDQLALLTAAHEAGAVRAQQGSSAERRFCTNNFLSGSTMMMITSMGHQLRQEIARQGFGEGVLMPASLASQPGMDKVAVLASVLCAGLFPNLASRKPGAKNYTTQAGQKAKFHMGSVMQLRGLKVDTAVELEWVAYSELMRGENAFQMRAGTMVPTPLALLLLCGSRFEMQELDPTKWKVKQGWVAISVEGFIQYQVPHALCSMLRVLRNRLLMTFAVMVRSPRSALPAPLADLVATVGLALSAEAGPRLASMRSNAAAGAHYGGGKGGGKGGDGGGRPGDWLCPQCGGNNFSGKTACFKCGLPKGEKPAAGGGGGKGKGKGRGGGGKGKGRGGRR